MPKPHKGTLPLALQDRPSYKPYWGLTTPRWCTVSAGYDHVQASCYQALENDNTQTMGRPCLYTLITDVLCPQSRKTKET